MPRTQESINKDILCKRDVLALIIAAENGITRKAIFNQLSYSHPRVTNAIKELVLLGQINRKWQWGEKGNWEYLYFVKKED